ncbi:YkgJ family cysteine cluster protein [Candidatus Omnitrophota bacterium]
MQLKQFVPQEFCLRCDVCCRFSQPDTVWAPLFTESEVRHLIEDHMLPPTVFTDHPKGNNSSAQRINLLDNKDNFICPCFNLPDQKCKIYNHRPFECQLYPFLLNKKDNKFYLTKDNGCPYFKSGPEDIIKNQIDYLKQEFQKEDMCLFLKQNQELFVEYPSLDLEILFPINF